MGVDVIAPSLSVVPDEEWELDLTIADVPAILAEACGTGDGCDPSCASSCASR